MLTVIMIFLGIAVLLLFDGVLENYFPTTKEYSIQSPKIKEEKKVVLLTDLHACCVGGKKDKYLQMIQKQNPDILLLAGDMTVKNGKRTDCVIEFLKGIRSIAPVYYAPGNHEIRMPEYVFYPGGSKFRDSLSFKCNRKNGRNGYLWAGFAGILVS